MLSALENAMREKYHIDCGYKYLTPEFFTRPDKIDRFQGTSTPSGKAEADPGQPSPGRVCKWLQKNYDKVREASYEQFLVDQRREGEENVEFIEFVD